MKSVEKMLLFFSHWTYIGMKILKKNVVFLAIGLIWVWFTTFDQQILGKKLFISMQVTASFSSIFYSK